MLAYIPAYVHACLPVSAAAVAGTGSLSGGVVTQFQRDLAGRVAEREAALKSIKDANR
jgi:hypothetical protein